MNILFRLLALSLLLSLTSVVRGQGTFDVGQRHKFDHTHDHTLKDHGYTYATAKVEFPFWVGFCEADGWTQAEVLGCYEIVAAHNNDVLSTDTYMNYGAVYNRPGRVTQSRATVIDPHGWYRVNYPLITALGHYIGGGSNVYGKSVGDSEAPKGSTPGTALVIDHATWITSRAKERICMRSSAWGLDYGQVGGIAYSEGCVIEGYRFVGGHSGPVDGSYWSTGLAMADMGEAGGVYNCMSEGFNGPGYCFVGGTPGMFQALSSFYNANAGFEFRSTSGLHQSVAIGLSGDENREGLITMTAASGGVAGGSITFIGCKSESRTVGQRLATLKGSFNVSFTGCWVSVEGPTIDAVFVVDGRNANGGQDWQLSVDGLKHTSNVAAYVKDVGNGKTYAGSGAWKPVSFVLNDAGLFGATRTMSVNGSTVTPPPVGGGTNPPPPVGNYVDRTNWTISAWKSAPNLGPALMKDGSTSTFYHSGESMSTTGTQWITVDMRANKSIAGITFGCGSTYVNDYPDMVIVQTSSNGTTWTERSRTGGGQTTTTTFPAVTCRWFRLAPVMTPSTSGRLGPWLAIAELNAIAP